MPVICLKMLSASVHHSLWEIKIIILGADSQVRQGGPMYRKKVIAAILALSAAAIPVTDTILTTPVTAAEEKPASMNIPDRSTILLNSAKLTDKIAAQSKNKNIMFSPTSLNFALGMLAQGAKGDTLTALEDYLGTEDFAGYASAYLSKIQDYNQDASLDAEYRTKLKIADALWADEDLPLYDDFCKKVSDNFQAEVQNLDFSDAENVCKTINHWCDENTEGMIPEIITPDSITKDTGLCITNSLYFESGWSEGPWNLSQEEEAFGDQDEKTFYMTTQGDQYYENDQATAFGRNYASGLSFIGILPKNEGEFTLEELDIGSLLDSQPEYDEVCCKMPKLNFETSAVLSDMLSELGLEAIFSDQADFSGLSTEPTKVDSILQKTKLELNEEGTRAAAVTSILMEALMDMPEEEEPVIKEVYLDRPFAFLIYDAANQEVLFMGKVTTVTE